MGCLVLDSSGRMLPSLDTGVNCRCWGLDRGGVRAPRTRVIYCPGLSEELNFEKILLPISFLFKIQNSTSIYGLLKIFGFDKSLVMHQSCRLI